MKIGAMNNPSNDLYEEIEFIMEHFEFIDLTLEPETAYAENIDTKKIQKLVGKKQILGHTPWNLPIASPYKSVREAAIEEYMKCLTVFEKLNVKYVNAHPVMPNDLADPEKILKYNIEFFKKISKQAKKSKITIMMENTKSMFNELEIIATMLEEVPGLKLHWDVGHANLGNEGEQKTKLAFKNFKKKIVHVHFSDNNGTEDQHMPLGTGNINWGYIVKTMKESGYNKTVTLEIHTPDISYLLFSRDKMKFILNELEGK